MTNQGLFRNVNIIAEINASDTSNTINIYTPGLINPADGNSDAKYSGFVTSLRLTVDITSVPELILPSPDPTITDSDQKAIERDVIYSTSRKCLSLYLRDISNQSVLVGDILLFNRRPHYFIDLIKYFSSGTTFDVAPNTVISVQMKPVGFGYLEDNDKISVIGSVVEESPVSASTSSLIGN